MQDHQVFPDNGRGGQSPCRNLCVEFGDTILRPDDFSGFRVEAEGVSNRAQRVDLPLENSRRHARAVSVIELAVFDRVRMRPQWLSRLRIETQDALDFRRLGLAIHDEDPPPGYR